MLKNSTTQQDTGWGVIYRLNNLFSEVEVLAPSGQYDSWNFKLDRIWSNLVYKNPMEIKKSPDGKIISMDFSEDDMSEKDFLDTQILLAKSEMAKAKKSSPPEENYEKKPDYVRGKKRLYRALLKKEIWLRKKMFTLGLYLKEVEYNPAGAMFNR